MHPPSQYIYNIYIYPPFPPESLHISPSNYPIFLSNFEFGKHVVKFVFLTLGPTYEYYIVPTQASSTHREREIERVDMVYSRQVFIPRQPPVAAQNPTDNHPRINHLNHLHSHTHTYIHRDKFRNKPRLYNVRKLKSELIYTYMNYIYICRVRYILSISTYPHYYIPFPYTHTHIHYHIFKT